MKIKSKTQYLVPILIGLALLLLPQLAFAQEPNVSGIQAAFGKSLTAAVPGLFTTLNIILNALQAVLWPILILMGGLLTNDFVFSGGMATMLLNVWSVVRDFVNVMFVLVLLGVAIVNILSIDKPEFQIKTVLPKLVLGLILVNFSFFGCKVVIDFTNVLATSILAIPSEQKILGSNYNQLGTNSVFVDKFCGTFFKKSVVLKSQGGQAPADPQANAGSGELGKADQKLCDPVTATPSGPDAAKYKLTEAGKEFFATMNARNITLVMAVELMQITEIDKVNGDKVTGISDLTINTIFAIVFFVIYATAFVCLFLALLVRMAVVWITTALMPLGVLGWTFKPIGDRVNQEGKGILPNFKKAAFVPIPVAFVLSIGVIMITQLKQLTPGLMASTNPASNGVLVSGTSSLQDIMAGLGIAIFIWLATFEALGKGPWSPYTDRIQKAVGGFAEGLAKAPLAIPIIPTGQGNISLGAAERIAQQAGPGARAEAAIAAQASPFIPSNLAPTSGMEGETDFKKWKEELGKAAPQFIGGKEGNGEKFAKQLERFQKNMRWQGNSSEIGSASFQEFLEKMRAGEVKPEQFAAFLKAQGIKIPVEASVNIAKDAARVAGESGFVGVPEEVDSKVKAKSYEGKDGARNAANLKQSVADLTQRLDEVEKGTQTNGTTTPDAQVALEAMIKKLTEVLGGDKTKVRKALEGGLEAKLGKARAKAIMDRVNDKLEVLPAPAPPAP